MKNKGYILENPFTLTYVESNLEDPLPEYVQVKILYCSICGGDYSQYIGRRDNYPISLGHEFLGIIVKVGKSVSSFNINDKIISDFNYRCLNCKYCMSKMSHLCEKNDIQLFSNRAFFKYANIHYSYLYKIQGFDSDYLATLIEPFSCVIHALEKYDFKMIETIFINGSGSIGMLFSFYLSCILHKKVYVKDINFNRVDKIIESFNCKKFSDKRNYDLIIEATNSLAGFKYSLDYCKKNQMICVMSHLYGENTSFIYETICKKELQVQFPLRNGESKNIFLAEKYLHAFWEKKYNQCLSIHDFQDIQKIFKDKLLYNSNKQIIKISND